MSVCAVLPTLEPPPSLDTVIHAIYVEYVAVPSGRTGSAPAQSVRSGSDIWQTLLCRISTEKSIQQARSVRGPSHRAAAILIRAVTLISRPGSFRSHGSGPRKLGVHDLRSGLLGEAACFQVSCSCTPHARAAVHTSRSATQQCALAHEPRQDRHILQSGRSHSPRCPSLARSLCLRGAFPCMAKKPWCLPMDHLSSKLAAMGRPGSEIAI